MYGPNYIGTTPVKDGNGILITDRALILNRWVEHFQTVLNQQSQFDEQVLSEIPQLPIAQHLDEDITAEEVTHAINQLSSGKSPGIDGIPAEV